MSLPLSRDPQLFIDPSSTENQPVETLQPVEKVPPRPFALWGILIAGVFLPVIIPILVAVNWRRLGNPQRAARTLVYGFLAIPILTYIVVIGTSLFFVMVGVNVQAPPVSSYFTWLPYTVLLLLYISLIRQQRLTYKDWTIETGIKPTFWRFGCLGYLAIAVAALVVITAIERAFLRVLSSITW